MNVLCYDGKRHSDSDNKSNITIATLCVDSKLGYADDVSISAPTFPFVMARNLNLLSNWESDTRQRAFGAKVANYCH